MECGSLLFSYDITIATDRFNCSGMCEHQNVSKKRNIILCSDQDQACSDRMGDGELKGLLSTRLAGPQADHPPVIG